MTVKSVHEGGVKENIQENETWIFLVNNILGVPRKIQVLGGRVQEKPKYREDCPIMGDLDSLEI